MDTYDILTSACNDFAKYSLLDKQTYRKENQKFRQVTIVCRELWAKIQITLSMKSFNDSFKFLMKLKFLSYVTREC